MSERRIAAIVLAAGTSSRLGRPKQLLPVGQTPLLQLTLDVVRRSSLEPRVLVLGARASEVAAAVDARGFDIVVNSMFATGQASSLAAGLAALPEDVQGAIVLLGDQPLLPFWLLDAMVESFDPHRHVAVRPRYLDGPGNPVLIARPLFEELRSLTGDTGARVVLRRHADQIGEVPVPGWPTPRDVDTEEDYQALLHEWASTGAPDVPRFCYRCGAPVELRDAYGVLRPVCTSCRAIIYVDPKVATAIVVEIDGRLVMQQRAIDPGMGRWTFPGGFVDRGEPVEEAARREVLEEVGIQVGELRLIGVYAEPGETVVLVAYAASAPGQHPRVTDNESQGVGLFDPDDLPPLAFPRNARVVADWRRLTGRAPVSETA